MRKLLLQIKLARDDAKKNVNVNKTRIGGSRLESCEPAKQRAEINDACRRITPSESFVSRLESAIKDESVLS